MTYCR